MAAARGEWIKFLDSDDVLLPGSLAREVTIGRLESADLVVAPWETGIEDSEDDMPMAHRSRREPPSFEPLIDRLLEGAGVPTSAALYSSSLVDGLRWDPKEIRPDDWHFFLQACLREPRIARSEVASYVWIQHGGERVTGTSLLDYARAHHYVLRFLRRELERDGRLTRPRRRQLAQYFYRQMPLLAREDRDLFERGVSEILDLDPRFQPAFFEPKALARVGARILGFRRALLLRAKLRALVRGRQ